MSGVTFSQMLGIAILLVHFGFFLGVKFFRSKRKLSARDFMVTTLEALTAATCLILGLNVLYFYAVGELTFPPAIIEPPSITTIIALLLIASWLYVLNNYFKRMRGKGKRDKRI